MRIGVGDEAEAVEHREPPVHRRIRRKAGLHGEDVRGKIAVTLIEDVKTRLGAKNGKPRRPDVGGDEVTAVAAGKADFEEVARIQAENGPAVGGEIADAREAGDHAVGAGEVGRIEEMVNLADLVALLVDRGDLDLQEEAHGCGGDGAGSEFGSHGSLQVVTEAEEARLSRNQFLLDRRHPCGMREIARADDRDAFLLRPQRQVMEVEVSTRRPGILRVDVKVGVKAHLRKARGRRKAGRNTRDAIVA